VIVQQVSFSIQTPGERLGTWTNQLTGSYLEMWGIAPNASNTGSKVPDDHFASMPNWAVVSYKIKIEGTGYYFDYNDMPAIERVWLANALTQNGASFTSGNGRWTFSAGSLPGFILSATAAQGWNAFLALVPHSTSGPHLVDFEFSTHHFNNTNKLLGPVGGFKATVEPYPSRNVIVPPMTK
jgi:hypothetical protein